MGSDRTGAMGELLLVVLVVLVVVGLALLITGLARRSGADFEIRHRPGHPTQVRGRIPQSKVGEIRAFFARDLRPSRSVSVLGSFGPGRAVRLRIQGPLSPSQRQRVRNFLSEHLR